MGNETNPVVITSPAELPNVLRKIREARGLAVTALAERANCSKATISNYELGKRRPKIPTLYSVADVLGYVVEIHLVPKN